MDAQICTVSGTQRIDTVNFYLFLVWHKLTESIAKERVNTNTKSPGQRPGLVMGPMQRVGPGGS